MKTLPLPSPLVRFLFLLAVCLAILILPWLVHAQEVVGQVPAAAPPPAVDPSLLMLWDFAVWTVKALPAVLLTNVVLLFVRALWASRFAPEPATRESKRATRLVGLAAGLLFGVVGFAPPVDVPDAIGSAVLLNDALGRIAAGLFVAGLAMFGRDAIVKGVVRKVKRKGAPVDAAEETPGPGAP